MYPPSTADSCEYNGHLIQVRSISVGDAWTYIADIKTPDGDWLPPVTDHDRVYETSELALAEGISVGKRVVDS